MIANVWAAGAVAAVTLPGDRCDDLVTDTAAAIASWFRKVVVYEDSDRRGRPPGQMREMISAEVRRVRPDVICEHADGPQEAVARAVALAGGGPVLFLYEKLAVARDALAAIGAEPWPYAEVALDTGQGSAGQDDTVTEESLAAGSAQRIPDGWPGRDASADYEPVSEGESG